MPALAAHYFLGAAVSRMRMCSCGGGKQLRERVPGGVFQPPVCPQTVLTTSGQDWPVTYMRGHDTYQINFDAQFFISASGSFSGTQAGLFAAFPSNSS